MLEQDGWMCMRCRGSFGLFDIIAMHKDRGWKLVQVKATKQKYYSYKKDIEQIKQLQVPQGTLKELWVWLSPRQDREARGWQQINIQ